EARRRQVTRDRRMILNLPAQEIDKLEAGEPVNLQVLAILRDEAHGVAEERDGDEREDDEGNRRISLENKPRQVAAGETRKPAPPSRRECLAPWGPGGLGRKRHWVGGGWHTKCAVKIDCRPPARQPAQVTVL